MDREPNQNLKNILLTSGTLPEKALEAGKALVSAFFPLTKTQVVSDSHQSQIREDSSCPAPSEGLKETDVWLNGDLFALIKVELIPANLLRCESSEKAGTLVENQAIENSGYRLQAEWLEREAGKPIRVIELPEEEIRNIRALPFPGKEPVINILFKLGLLKLLTLVTSKELPWGILNGIRPAKLVHAMVDRGIPDQVQESVLEKIYAVRPDKVRLLREVASAQAGYLEDIKAHPEQVSLYVSIPFCPSRCSYCSFPGYALTKDRGELKGYLDSLRQEIRATGEMMSELGLWGSSLYIGGGTPSILSDKELRELLEGCLSRLPLKKGLELTVEAGRPDTLSEEKLHTLAACGVNRLSINPQTMQEKTLKRIGRDHTVERIVEMYGAARRTGRWVINMDVILGLPGEGLEEVESSLEQLASLRPDNLTVHALALKKGSQELELGYHHDEESQSEEMQKLAEKKARSWGLRPYYLYRQKRMAGNLENIGYAYPGSECLYNIAIMEERQSIIGLGAGATTKIVNPSDFTLKNIYHPTAWQFYVRKWENIYTQRKTEFEKIKRLI